MIPLNLEIHECEILAELLNKASFQGNIIEAVVVLKRKIEGTLNGHRKTETSRPVLVHSDTTELP